MVSFTIFKAASFLALISSLVSAAPAKVGVCKAFKVTSPYTYFTTTAGQCYQVSYDFGGHPPASRSYISVDLYEYKTDKFVANLVDEITASGISTPWFNVDAKKTGDYYFLVSYGPTCKPVKTPYFHVVYNKNSPPAVCPN